MPTLITRCEDRRGTVGLDLPIPYWIEDVHDHIELNGPMQCMEVANRDWPALPDDLIEQIDSARMTDDFLVILERFAADRQAFLEDERGIPQGQRVAFQCRRMVGPERPDLSGEAGTQIAVEPREEGDSSRRSLLAGTDAPPDRDSTAL